MTARSPEKFLRAILLLLSLALSAPLAQAADTAPDSVELLFWQSAERQGTPQAYRAYLGRYPSGFFAPLAVSALTKPAAVPVPAPEALKMFLDEAPSGAVSFKLGEAFIGPRALTVGRLGARKQIALPDGRWIALAADEQTVSLASIYANFPPVPRQRITTAVFGKFVGTRLVSTISISFSSQKSPSTANWTSVEGCERSGEVRLRTALPASSGYRTECTALAFVARPWSDDAPASLQVRDALGKLGATARGPALVSTLSFSERERGYYSVSRHDWPGVWLGDDAQALGDWRADVMDAPREAFVMRLWTWFRAYRDLASDAYANDLGEVNAVNGDFDPMIPLPPRQAR